MTVPGRVPTREAPRAGGGGRVRYWSLVPMSYSDEQAVA